MKGVKGQIAIFVIIAFAVVALIIALFLAFKNPASVTPNTNNIESSIEKCARDAVNEAVDKMLPQGGFIDPVNYKIYKNIKATYLCQNVGYFKPCINQHPLFINEEIGEIKKFSTPKIEECFLNYKSEMEKRNYNVSMGSMNLSIALASNRVLLDIKREVILEKNGQSQKTEGYNIEVVSPIYELSKVAMQIVNEQSRYCYFEYVGYMVLYPKFDIRVFSMADSTKVYTIKDKNSNKEMNIAIRGCVIPPGV